MYGKRPATIPDNSRSRREICPFSDARGRLARRKPQEAHRAPPAAARAAPLIDSPARKPKPRERPDSTSAPGRPIAVRSGDFQGAGGAPQRLLGVQRRNPGDLDGEQRHARVLAPRRVGPGRARRTGPPARGGCRPRPAGRPGSSRASRRPPERLALGARADPQRSVERVARPAPTRVRRCRCRAISSTSSSRPPVRKPPRSMRSSTAASIGVRTTSGSRPIWRKKTR